MLLKYVWIFLCLGSSMLTASDYYLSPSGNDSNSGTLAAPWKTFAKAGSVIGAGDHLYLRSGTYAERLILNGKSGTSQTPIVIRAYETEIAVINGGTLTVPGGGRQGLVVLENCSHIRLENLEITNYVTTSNSNTPIGIQIEGSGSGVTVKNCKVHHIWQSSTNAAANGFGISVYGTAMTPIDGLLLDGNEIYDLRTGQSESVVINGNVINFTVSNNHVHDCNNIGIDFIGYEGSAPAEVDRARNGVCQDNLVHGIDSRFNPGYGGNFVSGGGDGSAAGIYVDGGTDILIARNRVYGCNFGIELASEDASGFTEDIQMTDNLLHHNLGPGIIMGGYDSNRGKTRNCLVSNNTLYRNDTLKSYGGQIALQFYLENNRFKNNIVWADATTKQMIVHYVTGGTAVQRAFPAGNVFDYNLYFCEGVVGDIEFGLNPTGSGGSQGNQSYNGLAAWRTAIGGDTNSIFANPGFTVAVPSATPAAADFKPLSGASGIDQGQPSPGFTPYVGEKDFAGASRLANGRVDIGCYEFMTRLQSWRDQYFELPDGGLAAGNNEDTDFDGVKNLLEYSQGMDPTKFDTESAPSGSLSEELFRFTYRKDAPELTYTVRTSGDLDIWSPASVSEESDGLGSFWRDFTLTSGPFFVRFEVSEAGP